MTEGPLRPAGVMIWEVYTGKTPSPFDVLTVEPDWPVALQAALIGHPLTCSHDGTLAVDMDRRCTAAQLKAELTIARAPKPEPRESREETVGADTCDKMLKELGKLDDSIIGETVEPIRPYVPGNSTEDLVKQLVAFRES